MIIEAVSLKIQIRVEISKFQAISLANKETVMLLLHMTHSIISLSRVYGGVAMLSVKMDTFLVFGMLKIILKS